MLGVVQTGRQAPIGGAVLRVLRLATLPDGFEELRADATADGLRILDVLKEDWLAGRLRFDQPG